MSRSAVGRFRAALVGADSLLIECGEILLAKGHTIVAVAAGSRRVARWARTKGLAVIDATVPPVQWQGELSRHEFDWLFAITYLEILPDAVLAMPERGAINFHDAPLPDYVGLNTPAWALLNGEQEYGITWHMMTSGVDRGDIVSQRRFDIAEAETSLSLNTRNFEAAIESFGELVDALADDTVSAVPQDPAVERRTYRRADRPTALAVLDWTQPAAVLERTVRALDFGPRYPNPLGFAKLWNGVEAVLVLSAVIDDESGDIDAAPGTITAMDDDRIAVVAGDRRVLALSGFTTLTGEALTASDVAGRLGLTTGATLPIIDATTAQRWDTLGARLARSEPRHLDQLLALEPVELPWAATPDAQHQPTYAHLPLAVPAALADDAGAVVGAFSVFLARVSGKARFHLALTDASSTDEFAELAPFLAAARPLPVDVTDDQTLADGVAAVSNQLAAAVAAGPLLTELIARRPELAAQRELTSGGLLPIAVRLGGSASSPAPGTVVELRRGSDGWLLVYDDRLVLDDDAALVVRCIEAVLDGLVEHPETAVAQIDLLGPSLRAELLDGWNDTVRPYPDTSIHELIEAQVDRAPDTTAIIFEGREISYRQLDEEANRLAWYLVELGVGPDRLVGVHLHRGIDLVTAVCAVHKAGGAYVPLDPAYPSDRLAHMINDSGCRVILTDAAAAPTLPDHDDEVVVLRVDADRGRFANRPTVRPDVPVEPQHLAYCIYTSGSTGMPKGVLIEHRNAVNFFVGMDERVAHELPATWFAVTSLSFDISVLELLYTLARGFSVVIYRDRDRDADVVQSLPTASASGVPSTALANAGKPIDFSLFYFSGDESEHSGSNKYRLLLEGARWADEHGFCAVWTPERHFHAFGGLYPQPAVTGAAVAAVTSRIGIRAGSVVMPLSHPIRVAEAWSVVDNLSDGRVGVSFASGWQPNDFVLMPENFPRAKQAMFDGIDAVKRLWRGEQVSFPGPHGVPGDPSVVEVLTLPRPVQPELPVWVTSAGNPETYIQAGRIGANVLTHLLGQSIEQLAPKIAAYRQARAEAGFDPDSGVVSLMLHTFVGDDDDGVRAIVREPLKQYLGTSFSLLKEYAWAFPAFQRPADASSKDDLADEDFKNLSDDDLDAVLEFAYLRYYESSGLFGTPERCAATVDALKGIGVNEIACLVDFGVATDTVLASLPMLDEVRREANSPIAPTSTSPSTDEPSGEAVPVGDLSVASQLRSHGVTHLQCTPSMARMFLLDEDTRRALADVDHLFIGGEAFPVPLAKELVANSSSGNVTNMYGPTETTIWSTTWRLEGELDNIPIGTPIANTQIYILDRNRQLLPPGVPGELWIAGDGVVRGYHQRAELTAERFVPDPFRGAPHRMYLTGDLARWRRLDDGSAIVEFLGRADHQVKIRGYRIELGEIEAQLGTYPGVIECVVVVREDTPGDQQLVGYVAAEAHAIIDPSAVKQRLRQTLPDAMIPNHIIALDELPHTPNGKIDRNGLPALADVLGARSTTVVVEAANDLERQVLAIWEETLGRSGIGVNDNFFDIGGHSLLVVRMHRRLKEQVDSAISLTDLYRYPTVRGFVESRAADQGAATVQSGLDRAARRRAARRR